LLSGFSGKTISFKRILQGFRGGVFDMMTAIFPSVAGVQAVGMDGGIA